MTRPLLLTPSPARAGGTQARRCGVGQKIARPARHRLERRATQVGRRRRAFCIFGWRSHDGEAPQPGTSRAGSVQVAHAPTTSREAGGVYRPEHALSHGRDRETEPDVIVDVVGVVVVAIRRTRVPRIVVPRPATQALSARPWKPRTAGRHATSPGFHVLKRRRRGARHAGRHEKPVRTRNRARTARRRCWFQFRVPCHKTPPAAVACFQSSGRCH